MAPHVTLYTRAACSLCETAKAAIAEAREHMEFDYEEVDIDANPDLLRLYNDEVPVVFIDRKKAFKYKVDMKDLLKKLAERA